MEKYPLPLANPAVRQAYKVQTPELELGRELIAARMKAGLTHRAFGGQPGKE